jgi:amino acid permease
MKLFKLLLVITLLSVSSVVFAQNTGVGNTTSQNTNVTNTTSQNTGIRNQSDGATSIKLVNPLRGNDGIRSLPDLVNALLRIVLTIGTPIIALAIIYAGFQFVTAQGNPEKLTKARRTFMWVLIGAGILLASYVIAEAIVGTVKAIRGE